MEWGPQEEKRIGGRGNALHTNRGNLSIDLGRGLGENVEGE